MILKRIMAWANQNEGIIALVGLVIVLLGYVVPWLARVVTASIENAPQIALGIQQYREPLVGLGVLIILYSAIRFILSNRRRIIQVEDKLQILETMPETLLGDEQASNITAWLHKGKWSADKDGLSVTDSFLGGICKIGATWENYEVRFDFKIINKAAGWIVRAKSLDHYVMIQCNKNQLSPHIRKILSVSGDPPAPNFKVVDKIAHELELTEWNRVKTEVVGHHIKVWVNDKHIWSDSDLLQDFQFGTIGFRCSGREHALFRNIQVIKKSR